MYVLSVTNLAQANKLGVDGVNGAWEPHSSFVAGTENNRVRRGTFRVAVTQCSIDHGPDTEYKEGSHIKSIGCLH